VCACGTREYTAGDAVDAAIFRGELEPKWQAFLRHVAAEERADELELELDESAISAAAEEFRYRHDLITAEETEKWLSNRGLIFEDFSDYFARQYCVGAVDEGFSSEHIGYMSAAPELRHLFLAELILSGALEDMTNKLMWRLAALCAGKEPTPDAIAAEKRKFLHRIGIEPAQLAYWLEEMGRDSEWMNEMLAIEAAYWAHCDTLLVPEARQRELMALRLPLTRFEIELIGLESQDAAQEALAGLLRQMAQPLEIAARRAGSLFHLDSDQPSASVFQYEIHLVLSVRPVVKKSGSCFAPRYLLRQLVRHETFQSSAGHQIIPLQPRRVQAEQVT